MKQPNTIIPALPDGEGSFFIHPDYAMWHDIHGPTKPLQVGLKVRLPLFHEQHREYPDEYFITGIYSSEGRLLLIVARDPDPDQHQGPFHIEDLMPV